MLPLYLKAVPHLAHQSPQWRDQFTRHLSFIAIQGSLASSPREWLGRFVSQADEADWALWANHMMHDLTGAGADASDVLWEKWIGEYWTGRVAGVPRTISTTESAAMAGWVAAFVRHFGEAAELCLASRPAPVE
jgi:hypothetical protein